MTRAASTTACSDSLSGETDGRNGGTDQPQRAHGNPTGGPGSNPGRSTLKINHCERCAKHAEPTRPWELTAKQREALIKAHETGLTPWDVGSTTISTLRGRGLIERVYGGPRGPSSYSYRTTEAGARLVKEMT